MSSNHRSFRFFKDLPAIVVTSNHQWQLAKRTEQIKQRERHSKIETGRS